MRLLIQGFFVEGSLALSNVNSPDPETGEARFLPISCQKISMFAGMIFPDPENPDKLTGQLQDEFGNSVLTEVFVDENYLRFVKRYLHRNDLISYFFVKKGVLWVGDYSGDEVSKNLANCVTTVASDELLFINS